MKRINSILIFLAGCCLTVSAQLTIGDCQEKAQANYPALRKYRLIEQSKAYTLENANKAYLPQFQLTARATYQSAVTSLPISLPGMDVPSIKKDQYQAVLEASQIVWDGGAIRAQKQVAEAGAEVESRQAEVEMYALEDRVNQLFFGILSLDAQLEQNQILQNELQRNYNVVHSYVENGIANAADLDAVKVEQLNAQQIRTQIQFARKAYLEMLAVMMGEKLNETVELQKPEETPVFPGQIKRPELQLFEAQSRLFDSQKNSIQSSYLPKVGLFVQGGVGRPGLNMLSNDFEPFYAGGVRLSWNFGALYTQKNDLRKIEINKNSVDVQKDIFLYNLNLTTVRENEDIRRLKKMMQYDDDIIALRTNIRQSAEAKVANGTLSVTDWMQETSRENLARQAKAAHEIDLLLAIYKLKYTLNHE